jgi:heme/copper-type cytochrome/quinol oxidase subunit 2
VPASLGSIALSVAGPVAVGLRALWGSGETNLQQTNAVVWIMIALSAVGAIITFSFLVYALWKYRDPKVKNRRYG